MRPIHDRFPQTIAALEAGRQSGWHRGAQLYVSRHGEVLADWAGGEARLGVPIQPDTLTLWLSAGKPITAIAIAQLHDQGRLHFDDPVARHLPEFAAGGKATVTLRHLLTHTGGFRDADKIPENVGWAETIRRICETPLEPEWIPGWQAGYHRSGSWFILGEIVQRLSGLSLGHYAREHIFLPLGMSDSWLGLPSGPFRRYGERVGFTYLTQHGQDKPHPHWNNEAGCALYRPGSNVRGPIRELGRCYEALLALRSRPSASTPILKPDTALTLTTRQVAGLYDHTMRFPVDWGLGFYLHSRQAEDGPIPYGYGPHASAEAFGHSGAQSCCAFADPPHGLVVAWLCNGLPGEARHQQRAWRMNTAIYADLQLDAGRPQ